MVETLVTVALIVFLITTFALIMFIGNWVIRGGYDDDDPDDGGRPLDPPEDPDISDPPGGKPLGRDELREMIKTDIYVTKSGDFVDSPHEEKREKELV